MTDHRGKLMRMQSQALALEDAPGCRTCVHKQGQICGHPVYSELALNVEEGGTKLHPSWTPLSQARSEGEPCGPYGHLYERRRFARTREFLSRIQWSEVWVIVFLVFLVTMLSRRAALIAVPVTLTVWFAMMGAPIRKKEG